MRRAPLRGRGWAVQKKSPQGGRVWRAPRAFWLLLYLPAYSASDTELAPASEAEADSLVEAEAGSLSDVLAGSLAEVEAGSLVLATLEGVEAGALLPVEAGSELQATRPSARTQAAVRTANIFFIIKTLLFLQ